MSRDSVKPAGNGNSPTSWRDVILQELTCSRARLTLVADPDSLLLEEEIQVGIRHNGFELIPFEDPVFFRYLYEKSFRSRWDRGDPVCLVVGMQAGEGNLVQLPFDLLQTGRRLSFNLGDLFPTLSYPVVTVLDRGDLDVLYEASIQHAPEQLGVNATKEFVLRHVFEIVPELITSPADLLRVFLRRHYRGERIPALLDEWFVRRLRSRPLFDEWPLSRLAKDREAFFAFLQERWPIFIQQQIDRQPGYVRTSVSPPLVDMEEPVDLPFDHQDIRVYIDTLFVEGVLQAVPHPDSQLLAGTWESIGVQTIPLEHRRQRREKLMGTLQASIPAGNVRHTDWFRWARGWAELILLANEPSESLSPEEKERFTQLGEAADNHFTAWLSTRYAGLINLPPDPPVMLHHLPRYLSRQREEDSSVKVALIVIDGLALDQWLLVRRALEARTRRFQFREGTVFAWIPSLTSVSRQALFAGKMPVLFPDSIHNTEKESVLWRRFWEEQGCSASQIVYLKGLGRLGDDDELGNVSEALAHPQVRIAGLVVDTVDRIMHGMEMGTAGMHNQVSQWAGQPFLEHLLDVLLERNFRVWVTSDHGNVEAVGCGRPFEGAMVDQKGERVRIYPDRLLSKKAQAQFPTARLWDSVGLPDDFLALLAPPGKAFLPKNQRTISHGGNSIQELVVPLIRVER